MSVYAANERTYDSFGRWRTSTYAHSGEAGPVGNTVYIKGSEFVDGSVRFIRVSSAPVANLEARINGSFHGAQIIVDDLLLKVDAGLILSNAGDLVVHSTRTA